MNRIIKELVTRIIENMIFTKIKILFRIKTLPMNPNKGGKPPNENMTKSFMNLLWLFEDCIWWNDLFKGELNII